MRNGEAAAVNINIIFADDVYRIMEQVNQTTRKYGRLKHRKPGEHRDVPLSVRAKETIEWCADRCGTVDGYLLGHPMDPGRDFPYCYLDSQWRRIKEVGEMDISEGIVICGFRHFFASNCLSNGIPITDVAEWMGTTAPMSRLRPTVTSCPARSARPPSCCTWV
ncbi:hypothetical protein ACFY3M_00085 [Streptomyces mirabilis]|uniref:hypothetical protein n=1 Tax=Streptomyces mirabilis TaxID=68239 RepID=UPI003679CED1